MSKAKENYAGDSYHRRRGSDDSGRRARHHRRLGSESSNEDVERQTERPGADDSDRAHHRRRLGSERSNEDVERRAERRGADDSDRRAHHRRRLGPERSHKDVERRAERPGADDSDRHHRPRRLGPERSYKDVERRAERRGADDSDRHHRRSRLGPERSHAETHLRRRVHHDSDRRPKYHRRHRGEDDSDGREDRWRHWRAVDYSDRRSKRHRRRREEDDSDSREDRRRRRFQKSPRDGSSVKVVGSFPEKGKIAYHTLKAFGDIDFVVYQRYKSDTADCTVGSGGFGYVIMATDVATREKVAIKKIEDAFVHTAKVVLRETMILSKLEHENILSLKDIIRPQDRNNFQHVYLVTEYMETDLHKELNFRDDPFENELIQILLCQLLRGLKYLHSSNVLHRDLKPENVLINTHADIKKWRLKIADFGLSRTLSETKCMTTNVGTLQYRAPELLGSNSDNTDYSFGIDIWSVGCIFGEMLTGEPVFRSGKGHLKQMDIIRELLDLPDDSTLSWMLEGDRKFAMERISLSRRELFANKFRIASESARDLLEKMLVCDPTKRITVDAALTHEYLKHLQDKEKEKVCDNPLPCGFMESYVVEDVETIKNMIWNESLKFNHLDA